MKILFIYRINIEDPNNSGIQKKLMAQRSAAKLYHEADCIYHKNQAIYLNDEAIYHMASIDQVSKLKKAKYYHFEFYKALMNLDLSNYDLIYIRYHLIHAQFIQFLRQIKRNSKLKVVLELPTFPYQAEFRAIGQRYRLFLDKYYRNKLSRLVDYIVHFGSEEEIFNIPTINITNGIDHTISYQKTKFSNDDVFRMLAIGKWQFWHGLDRLIQGMAEYKGDRKLELNVIGSGREITKLKQLVNSRRLQKSVFFLGPKIDQELDEASAVADIGIGVLGMHRKQMREASPLKHREYCARGIPFIHSCFDKDFAINIAFAESIPSDDSPIEIENLIDFRNRMDASTKTKMQAYCKNKLSWDSRIKYICTIVEMAN